MAPPVRSPLMVLIPIPVQEGNHLPNPLFFAATGHFFYGALDGKFPKTDAGTVALKVDNY